MPTDRVTVSRPFQVTGIDFSGPLYPKGKHIRRSAISCCSPVRQCMPFTWNFVVTRPRIRSFWPSRDLFDTAGYRIPYTLATHRRSKRRTKSRPFSHKIPPPHCAIWYNVDIHRSLGGLVARSVGKNDWNHKKMPKESVGAVTGHGRIVDHHPSQHRYRPEFKVHNTRHLERINTCAFPLWCKTDDVVLDNSQKRG
jgi:hypothetical protein